MSLLALGDLAPVLADRARCFVADNARLVGRIRIGLDVSIWFGAVLRGDNDAIELGDECNVQDGAVIHVDAGFPVVIGRGCTIGHCAIVHGATIGANSLIGMGATVMNGARIGGNSLVGARSLVTENKTFPDGSLIMGAPARLVRALSPDEIEGLRRSAGHYVANGRRYAAELRPAPVAVSPTGVTPTGP